jgi:hypothetical protein
MHELARVTLHNEMDLILAHKRSMKLAEIAGLSLPAQTTFATAVSEVSRSTILSGNKGCLILSVDNDNRDKYIVACLKDNISNTNWSSEGLAYARKLVSRINISTKGTESTIELYFNISPSFRIDLHKVDEWRRIFRNEPPISSYEELKRKNEQLQELSEKVQKSEEQYKTLTNSLPLIIFSLDSEGQLHYANEWLLKFTGQNIDQLNRTKWKSIIHADDYDPFCVILNSEILKGSSSVRTQARLRNSNDGEYLWHQVSITPIKDEKTNTNFWIGYIVDIHTQKMLEKTLQDNTELKLAQDQLKENQIAREKYIDELNRSNRELQQFAFIASHDLQEPVRKLLFYSDYLLGRYSEEIDDKGKEFLDRMQKAGQRMRNLIQDLLIFSQINKEELRFDEVDLNTIAEETLQDFDMAIEERKAKINFDTLPRIKGDKRMLSQLFNNLIGNALKYSRPEITPEIFIGYKVKKDTIELSIKDNGIGFNEKYLPQMFTLFQRLHTRESYEGTGLGLAICRKIVEIHSGAIRAESVEGLGSTFYISFPNYQKP